MQINKNYDNLEQSYLFSTIARKVSEYSAAHPEAARRPAWSALDNRMLRCTVGDGMRDWKQALGCFFEHYKNV